NSSSRASAAGRRWRRRRRRQAWHPPRRPPEIPHRRQRAMPPPRAPRSGRRRQQRPQASDRAGFDLPDALGRHAVLVGEFVQRGLVFAHPAALQDRAAAIVQARKRLGQLLGGGGTPFLALGLLGRVGIGRGQIGRRAVAFLVLAVAAVLEGQVARREATLHLRYLVGAHAQITRDGAGLLGGEPGEVFLQATQIEEQLA